MIVQLRRHIAQFYPESEWPAQAAQTRDWAVTRPLAGLRVLDVTPSFANTLPKYLALMTAGADVTVGTGSAIPSDPGVLERLPDFGIAVTDQRGGADGYDVIFDCAGTHAEVPSRLGYVELTRSGRAYYENCPQPVVLVDASEVKRIETSLGTGDGFVRAMAHLGYPVEPARSVVVVGGGKVGFGVAAACLAAGADVAVVDHARVDVPDGAELIDALVRPTVSGALARAWCVVSATGVPGALAPLAADLCDGDALLANMGAEDEFGPSVPAGRVLNGKIPVNFVLTEPTRLRYLDPTMALSNASAVELLHGRVPPGVHPPAPASEQAILDVVRQHGAMAHELDAHGVGTSASLRSR